MLVKDGKPCSGSSTSTPQQSSNSGHSNTSLSNGNNNLITNDANNHSPDAASILPNYQSTAGHQTQMLQQPCNNSIMSNSLAMAYRNQNNFISNQQQCSSYLPLQGRAW